MNKNIKRLISLLCSITCAFSVGYSFTACQDAEKEDLGYVETDKPFIKNGRSDYKIVVPDEALEREWFAASELQYFLEKATDYRMEIVTESSLTKIPHLKRLS